MMSAFGGDLCGACELHHPAGLDLAHSTSSFSSSFVMPRKSSRHARLDEKKEEKMRVATAMLLALWSATGVVRAQDVADDFQHASAAAHQVEHYTPAFAGVEVAPCCLLGPWTVAGFHIVWTRGAPHYVIRRVTGYYKQASKLTWADSRTCPAVHEVLLKMESLPAPHLDAPALGADNLRQITTDGTAYSVWGSGDYAAGGSGGMHATGNDASPIAAWWRAAETSLAGCWTDKEPSLD